MTALLVLGLALLGCLGTFVVLAMRAPDEHELWADGAGSKSQGLRAQGKIPQAIVVPEQDGFGRALAV